MSMLVVVVAATIMLVLLRASLRRRRRIARGLPVHDTWHWPLWLRRLLRPRWPRSRRRRNP
ncbi:hypothetical protein [Cryobacterium sp. CG_9.6]|uniref:hypothetical protein n=1 Tax=Cryobacterium sp. CG_9.6 TaxID=2760710 RepID=UPI002476A3DC|nr:hypothetical protein [Cryobacterium sp. CG_9.6]MDH6237451.1 hypothetical protein [Cryobacterium sp. CG_9.6]